jgi:26S proteasome regulatory subunit N11
MLLNLHKKSWMDGLCLADYSEHCKINESTVAEMLSLASSYNKVKLNGNFFQIIEARRVL